MKEILLATCSTYATLITMILILRDLDIINQWFKYVFNSENNRESTNQESYIIVKEFAFLTEVISHTNSTVYAILLNLIEVSNVQLQIMHI